ncbi:MAG: Phospho-N-acetylmuramoyl-pentapeptide-transferase, partial [uncultured Thermomicrobiales bacterium]
DRAAPPVRLRRDPGRRARQRDAERPQPEHGRLAGAGRARLRRHPHHRSPDRHLPSDAEGRQGGPLRRSPDPPRQDRHPDHGRHHGRRDRDRDHPHLQHRRPPLDAAAGRRPPRLRHPRRPGRPAEPARPRRHGGDERPWQDGLAGRRRHRRRGHPPSPIPLRAGVAAHLRAVRRPLRARAALRPGRRLRHRRHRQRRQLHRRPGHPRRRHGGDRLRRLRDHRLPPGAARRRHLLLHDGRRPDGLPVVQCPPGPGLHGRHRLPGDRRRAGDRRLHDRAMAAAAGRRRRLPGRDDLRHPPGRLVQVDPAALRRGAPPLPDDPAPPPLRDARLVGDAGHDALLDAGDDVGHRRRRDGALAVV